MPSFLSLFDLQKTASLFKKLRKATPMDFIALLARPLAKDSSNDPYHLNFRYFIDEVNRLSHCNILELGSRGGKYRAFLQHWNSYTGFDIYPGEGVDIVGDIHSLSQYFPHQRFDAVFTISTFEHLAMPWKAALEISKVMKQHGLLFVATHPTWPPHMLPWDFWRFSSETFKVLLGPSVGFEIIRCSEGLPCRILPLNTEEATRGIYRQTAYMGVSVVARKVAEPAPTLAWDIDVCKELKTMYPAPDHAPSNPSL